MPRLLPLVIVLIATASRRDDDVLDATAVAPSFGCAVHTGRYSEHVFWRRKRELAIVLASVEASEGNMLEVAESHLLSGGGL